MIAILTAGTASRYAEEIVAQAGLAWRRVAAPDLATLTPETQVLLLAGDGRLARDAQDAVARFVETGGALVATGGTWGLERVLGATTRDGDPGGFVIARQPDHPIASAITHPLHVFAGGALHATTGTAMAGLTEPSTNESRGDAVVINRPGKGATVAIGPDIPASVLRIQLGRSIHEDGAPAPDGTAPIDDGILKTDDGVVLAWDHDRFQMPVPVDAPACPGRDDAYPAGDTPWFAHPIADELRDLLLRAIHWAARAAGQLLASIWVWPRRLPAVGLISHDSDLNIDASAHTTLRLLARAGIHSTWCHMWGPTYPDRYERATFDRIREGGHELALHYNAFDQNGGAWGREHLATQAAFVRAESGADGFVSNKNHYLRWEGEVEFFHWLVDEGIQADQCKGPSKKGNVGYPHGSCLPWFPFDAATGDKIDVIEIPLQFQDLWLTAPPWLASTTIEQARRHHGVAHFLFHQVHLHTKPEVVKAMLATIDLGRERGLEWWTSAEINAWTRHRRDIGCSVVPRAGGPPRLEITTPAAVASVTIALTEPATGTPISAATAGGKGIEIEHATHAGLPAVLLTLDLPFGRTVIDLA